MTLKSYREFSPSGMDRKGLGLPDKQNWLVSGISINRDSDLLSESNWETQERILAQLDPEGLDHSVERFGHWACGWFEIMIARPGSNAAGKLDELTDTVRECCVLDSSDYSEKKMEAIQSYWNQMSLKEKIQYCQKARVSIFSARKDSPPEKVEMILDDELT